MVVSYWLIAGWFDDIHLVSQTVIIYFGTNRTQSYPTMTYCRRQKRYIYKGFHGLFLKTFMSRMGLKPTFFRLRDKRLDLSPRAVRCLLVKPGMASNITVFYYFIILRIRKYKDNVDFFSGENLGYHNKVSVLVFKKIYILACSARTK